MAIGRAWSAVVGLGTGMRIADAKASAQWCGGPHVETSCHVRSAAHDAMPFGGSARPQRRQAAQGTKELDQKAAGEGKGCERM